MKVAGDAMPARFIRNELPDSVFWDLRIGWMVRWNPASILVDGPYLLSTESTEVSGYDWAVLFDKLLHLSLKITGTQFLTHGNQG